MPEQVQQTPIKTNKHFFNEKAKEANEKYQVIRDENKDLKDLLKMYNITKTRNETFKKQLKNNLLFCEDSIHKF